MVVKIVLINMNKLIIIFEIFFYCNVYYIVFMLRCNVKY